MKRRFYISFLATVLLIGTGFTAGNKCESEDFLDECSAVIRGFRFLKAHKISVAKPSEEVEYKSVFSKGSTYILTACNGGGGEMVVTLYDRNKKKIMSNYVQGKHYPAITYNCAATGVYYLKYSFQDNGNCGVGLIGFKK